MPAIRDPDRYFGSVLARGLEDIESGTGPRVEEGRHMALLVVASRVFSVAVALRQSGVTTLPSDDDLARELERAGVASGMNGGARKARQQVRRALAYGTANPAPLFVGGSAPPASRRVRRKQPVSQWKPVEVKVEAPSSEPSPAEIQARWDRAPSVGGVEHAADWCWSQVEDAAHLIAIIERLDLARAGSADWPVLARRWSAAGEPVALHRWRQGDEDTGGSGILAGPVTLTTLETGRLHPVSNGELYLCRSADFLVMSADEDRWSPDGLAVAVASPVGWTGVHAERLGVFSTFYLDLDPGPQRDRVAASLEPYGRVLEVSNGHA